MMNNKKLFLIVAVGLSAELVAVVVFAALERNGLLALYALIPILVLGLALFVLGRRMIAGSSVNPSI